MEQSDLAPSETVYVGVVSAVNEYRVWFEAGDHSFLWQNPPVRMSYLPHVGQTIRIFLYPNQTVSHWEPWSELDLIESLERQISRPLSGIPERLSREQRIRCVQIASRCLILEDEGNPAETLLSLAEQIAQWVLQ